MKAHLRSSFRSAPHVAGTANVKPRDYEQLAEDAQTVDAPTPYAAFFAMKETATPLEPGDLLETDGMLRIFKYVGFEEAQWVLPEPKQAEAAGETKSEETVLASNAST